MSSSGAPRTAKPAGGKKRRRRRQRSRGPALPAPSTLVNKSTDEPLSDRELTEARTLLDFLKQHKSVLRLSLNATEDLLINGRRDPTERGVLLHLFRKVDAQAVDRALAREPLASDPKARARFMAGVVRLAPGPKSLLGYLEAVADSKDPRQAARALSGVATRLEFDAMSRAQWLRLMELVGQTFEGPDRVQALLGLLDNPSFKGALDTHRTALAPERAAEILPLARAHAHVVGGETLPGGEADRALVVRGMKAWLSLPEPTLRSFPEPVRWRLAERAVSGPVGLGATDVPKGLVESLPHHERDYARIGMAWSRRLLAEEADTDARALLSQVAEAHPSFRDAARLLTALDGPRVGTLTFERLPRPGRWAPACWLPGALFGLGRWVDRSESDAAMREAELQADLLEAGFAPVVASGQDAQGRAFAFTSVRGLPLAAGSRVNPRDALSRARAVAQIARTLATRGIELPDLNLERFVLPKRGGPTLVDIAGAKASDPPRAAMALAEPARNAVKTLLQSVTVPEELAQRIERRLPLALLVRSLFEV